MSGSTVPDTLSGLQWLIGTALIVGIPALSGFAVAVVQRPVKRDAREAREQATAAAESSDRAAASSAHAATELTPNHGSSTKDQTARIERQLDALLITVARVESTGDATALAVAGAGKDIGGLREELRTERRERIGLGERLDSHINAH